jgi:RNA polymerase sigma factor (sigma-70 family)
LQNGFNWPGSISDGDLIARVLAGDDRNAFAELVRRYQSDVRSLCRRLAPDWPAADDLAQETFLRAYRGLGRYRGGAKFSTWLYRIAYNLFLSEQRRKQSVLGKLTAAAFGSSEEQAPPDRSDERQDLERALSALRPEERVALVLTYARDVSHEEAAAILECPLGTLKTHVARAKEKLRRLLSEAEGPNADERANG